MADRVAASIVIGGHVSSAVYAQLAHIAVSERLSTEWGGEPFEASHRPADGGLALYGEEVAWGRFDELEALCSDKLLPFVRWSGSASGSWGAERVVFTGEGEPRSFAVDDDDLLIIARDDVVELGSFEAIIAHFDGASFVVPPLVVEDDPAPPPSADPAPSLLAAAGLNAFQRTCAEVYCAGDFAHIETVEAARDVGDTLFAFLMIELSSSEGCSDQSEAVRRLEMTQSHIQGVISGIVLRSCRRAEDDR